MPELQEGTADATYEFSLAFYTHPPCPACLSRRDTISNDAFCVMDTRRFNLLLRLLYCGLFQLLNCTYLNPRVLMHCFLFAF